MIDRDHALSVTKQAELVGIARSTVYQLPRPVPAADLEFIRRIDRLLAEFPFAGSPMLCRLLAANWSKVGRCHVKTLMSENGDERVSIAVHARRNPSSGIRCVRICCASLLSRDPIRCGRWTSRTSQWRAGSSTSRSFSTGSRPCSVVARVDHGGAFCVAALEEALARHGRPEIFNTDQGSQFTCQAFTGVLGTHEIRISMDGKAHGRTTCSSSGSGGRSNTRRFTSVPTTACRTRAIDREISRSLQSTPPAFER